MSRRPLLTSRLDSDCGYGRCGGKNRSDGTQRNTVTGFERRKRRGSNHFLVQEIRDLIHRARERSGWRCGWAREDPGRPRCGGVLGALCTGGGAGAESPAPVVGEGNSRTWGGGEPKESPGESVKVKTTVPGGSEGSPAPRVR